VRASAPIFSFVHCFKRSNFLLMFIVAVVRREKPECEVEMRCNVITGLGPWTGNISIRDAHARHTNRAGAAGGLHQPELEHVSIKKSGRRRSGSSGSVKGDSGEGFRNSGCLRWKTLPTRVGIRRDPPGP
jgi:hypothetical protein